MDYYNQLVKIKRNRFTIGFLDENDTDEFHSLIAEGIFEAAKKFDVNVIRFGHLLNSAELIDFTMETLLDYIEQIDLDGLIFLGWSRAVALNKIENFKKRFSNIPLLSLGKGFEDIPQVFFEEDKYFRDVLLHLINVHHYQRIAFIEPIQYDNRSKIYQEITTECGIDHSELIVTSEELVGYETSLRGRRAISVLLDQRKVGFEAIVSLYNAETEGIIEELKLRGISVPKDIAVTSFGDSALSKYSSPPVTTVYFPCKELGYSACKIMIQLLSNKTSAIKTEINGKLRIRESCGCCSQSIALAKVDQNLSNNNCFELSDGEWDEIENRIIEVLPKTSIDLLLLLRKIRLSLNNRNKDVTIEWFKKELRANLDYDELSKIKDIISIIRINLLPFLKNFDFDRLIWFEDLLQQAQILIREKLINAWGNKQIYLNKINYNLEMIIHKLLSDFSIQNIVNVLESNLKLLDIESCSIYLFKEPEIANPFENCELVFHYHENQKLEPLVYQHDDTRQLIAKTLFPHNRAYSMMSNLLLVSDQLLGFIIFEPKVIQQRIYQVLSNHISIVLCGTMLIEKLDNSYKKLLEQAHRQGMADIISGTLHNICNVLNSINISIHMMKEYSKSSQFNSYYKASALLKDNIDQMDWFIENDPKGEKLLEFLIKLNDVFGELHSQMLFATNRIEERLGSIEDILATHQNFTLSKPNLEKADLCNVIESALIINLASIEKYKIKVIRKYEESVTALIQKTKLFHILLNLIKNAKEAMLETVEADRKLTISVYQNNDKKYIQVADNGYGIPSEKLEQIFTYGFTTKEDGHGFGLHSCANYMTEMNGKIWAESDGVGKGATFILEFN